ncbi:hypothetical protein TWF718_009055 [Orbilia javanica]|uniref:Uncharacterized protein n=1 Tax=Orbilia javanica TaxID=47235 RepID=A0AAN8MNY8_9PEZI
MADQENKQFSSSDNVQLPQTRAYPPPPTRPPPPIPSPLTYPPISPPPPSSSLSSSPPLSLNSLDPLTSSNPLDTSGHPACSSQNHLDINFPWEGNNPTDRHLGRGISRSKGLSPLPKGPEPAKLDSITSFLSHPLHGKPTPIHGIEYRLIKKQTSDSTMPQQSAFVYMDNYAVISILSILGQINSDHIEVYLHTQSSLAPGAPGSYDETSISEFRECFMDPTLDPVLTRKLRAYWWSLECTLTNGVIIIHSLSQSLYDNVYIFKFSPVTGVFCKLVPQEISDMRAYLLHHSKEYDPRLFPRVPSIYQANDREKRRNQLGSGMISAAKSMTNLANTVGRRFSGSSLSTMSGSLLDGIKNNIIPTLMDWNALQYKNGNQSSPSGFTVHQNITSSNIAQRGAENRPSSFSSKRPSSFRSTSASYLRHPLQTLRHHSSSVSVLPARIPEGCPSTTTPIIILITPEQDTAILKLGASIPKNPKAKGFWQSVGETIAPKKLETPTFVFWKDVFDQISFETRMSSQVSSYPVELDTDIRRQVADNFNRLLVGVTDMYVKEAGGIQFDFIRMKIPSDEEDYQSFNVRMYHPTRIPPPVDHPIRPAGDSGMASRRLIFDSEPESSNLGSESSHGSIALSDGAEPTEEEIRRQGQILANNLKPDQKLELTFNSSELEFSSVLLSQDTYLVEAVLAGWFADASEWMKESGLRWRHMLFDRQAAKGPGIETETVAGPV